MVQIANQLLVWYSKLYTLDHVIYSSVFRSTITEIHIGYIVLHQNFGYKGVILIKY